MLAVEQAIPRDLDSISPEQIVQVKYNLAEEVISFREHVASQATELAHLAAISIDERRLTSFSEHARVTIEAPLRRLERGLSLLNIPTVRATLTASSFAPPAIASAALAAGEPVIATAGSVVSAVGIAWWNIHTERSRLRESSPVAYLLDVRDELTVPTLARRARRLYLGTYGR